MFFSPDAKDIFYLVAGIAFLSLAVFPLLKSQRFISAPIAFVVVGGLLALLPFEIPIISSMLVYSDMKVFEHITELLVIISLAGAGLALDRRIGIKSWQHTWVLLGVVMPLTIVVVTLLGTELLYLSVPGSILLAACIAPTDPVLARSVQVDGPNKGEENDVNVTLTSEAGLNDGLAFPFIYLALAAANAGFLQFNSDVGFAWLGEWALYDLVYRVAVGAILGYASGWVLSHFIHRYYSDVKKENFSAGLILFASVFITYGITELCNGYGFLAVFIAALAGRKLFFARNSTTALKKTHYFSDQVEQILLALLLLWLGFYCVNKGLDGITILEVAVSASIVLVLRPLLAYACLYFTKGSVLDKFAISFLGIRGIGTFYYLAYAESYYEFGNIEQLWRVALMCVLISILVHGIFAHRIMEQLSNKES